MFLIERIAMWSSTIKLCIFLKQEYIVLKNRNQGENDEI